MSRDQLAVVSGASSGIGQARSRLVAKGILGPGAFETSDCRGTYAQLSERGVNFLSEPTERPYGIEATLRDNSGNWFSMSQH